MAEANADDTFWRHLENYFQLQEEISAHGNIVFAHTQINAHTHIFTQDIFKHGPVTDYLGLESSFVFPF